MPTNHLVVKGRVQGVFFRASARDVASATGIKGWVRNTEDGDVEIMAAGTEAQLQKFIDWCRQGPRRAEVTDVIVTPADDQAFDGFEVVRR